MKLNIRCVGLFERPSDDGLVEESYNLPATRFNIHNEEELNTSNRR